MSDDAEILDGIYYISRNNTLWITDKARLWFKNKVRYFDVHTDHDTSIAPDDYPEYMFQIDIIKFYDWLKSKTYRILPNGQMKFFPRFYELDKLTQMKVNTILIKTFNHQFTIDDDFDEFIYESKSNLFQTLLEAAFKPKAFTTKDELFTTIKSLLKDSGIEPYKEKKTSQGVKPRGGYKMPEVIVHDTLSIEFDSVDDNNKHNFYSKLNSNKIDFTRTHSGIITIKLKDNVDSDDLLSDEAKDELTSDYPEIIGTLSQGILNPETGKLKRSTSNAINKFNQHQKKIYDELIKHGLIYWKQQKTNYKLEKR